MPAEYVELSHMERPPGDTDDGRRAPRASGVRALLCSPAFRKEVLLCGMLMGLWYSLSGLLLVCNKWLFGASERNFPFPLLVTSMQMLTQYGLAHLCLRLFPSLQPPRKATWGAYLSCAVPCGVASALDIGLGNISLRTITLTFLTMCKSSALGFLLLFAFLFGLERVRLALVAVVAIISAGVVLMAAGEVDFVLVGFLEAIGSAAMGGLRWSLTQMLLSQARFGMANPVATMASLTPIVGATTLLLSLAAEHPLTEIARNSNTDSLRGALTMALLMIAGGVVAFGMVLAEFQLIARTSALTLSIAGMLKEVAVVAVAHAVFGDNLSPLNLSGMLVALLGIGLYNWLKIHDMLSNTADTAGSRALTDSDLQLEAARLRQAALVADPYDEGATTATSNATAVDSWPADDAQQQPKKPARSSSHSDDSDDAGAWALSAPLSGVSERTHSLSDSASTGVQLRR
ncbi:hypothetical protein H4R19_004672 [Coemansia spiralis]|nr:hypothetical protein H4R19_004672 [Coemansia spiralis]